MTLIRCTKTIFYHIPKTGGVWVENALKTSVKGRILKPPPHNGVKNDFNLYYGHKPPSGVHERHKNDRFSFAFVRHPLAWYRSFWCYRMMYGIRGRGGIFPPDDQWSRQPNRFIERMLGAFPDGFLHMVYKEYVGENGDKLDFVGRTENLVDDLVKALNIAGEDFDESKVRSLKRKNASVNHATWKLTKDMEKRLLKAEKWVIDTFYD